MPGRSGPLRSKWGANTSMFAVFDGKFGSGLQSYRGDVGFKLDW
jgi:hypothetical protein